MAFQLSEVEHNYPKNIHILNNGYLNTLLTKISQAKTIQPHFNSLLSQAYRELLIQVLNNEWPMIETECATRMTAMHPEQKYKGKVFDDQQKAVCVDVARAGMVPSQVIFDMINHFTNPIGVRQDHVFASRVTDERDQVTHTSLSSSKIGGDIENALVFLPDPMGATGNSLCEVVNHYKKKVEGTAKRFISVHLIITPEFIRKVCETHPDIQVYAARLDRGFSTSEALKQPPGSLWDQEKGLNEQQYIVPGAGGVGELINNSFV
ncbi:MAG: uracil phosphoribosyltransferase [Bdellovibrionales bacterium]|nr:uracil phosphoribosyltransferase [Bdellovibrionales bacterium]